MNPTLEENHILRNEPMGISLPLKITPHPTNPYLAAATSMNTRRAYQADIQHFEQSGGHLPASKEEILQYLQTFASQLNPRTLSRRLTALKHWHVYQGFPDPTQHPMIAKTLTGILRTHGKPKNKAPPLLPEQLVNIIHYLATCNTLSAYRDMALLQVGFLGALRRSELVAIRVEHIHWQSNGIEILIPKSKTDQLNTGQYCVIPNGNEQLCAIRALKIWLEKSQIKEGAIFRRIQQNLVSETAIVPVSVNHILKRHAQAAGLENAQDFSSHSMRRGLATSASRDGVSLPSIMRQGRWKQTNTVLEYIEATQRFEENAAGFVLQKMTPVVFSDE